MNEARPFLRWAGSKRSVIPELLKHVPSTYGTYHEIFLGGGSLFFALKPERAVLYDANELLIRTYRAVRNQPDELCSLLDQYSAEHAKHQKAFYDHIRGFRAEFTNDADAGAWMIYLNKTCFNGLWRVNRSGKFNVPFDPSKTSVSYDRENITACSTALQAAALFHADFRKCTDWIRPGDFSYFDPPYAPLSSTSDFTSYTAEGFKGSDQRDLRDLALQLKRSGVHVVLSNSSADSILQLYESDFKIHVIGVRRAVNSKADARGAVKEFIIT